MIVCKSPAELERMRAACGLVADILAELRGLVAPGVTTADLDAHAEGPGAARGGVPAFKGYHGFPATLCTSVNDEVIHGIPGRRALRDGDVVSIDLGRGARRVLRRRGDHGAGGAISERRRPTLLRVTEESLYRGHRAGSWWGRA